MAASKRPEPLSGADVVARTPRVFTYLAAVLEAQLGGDDAYNIEAPSDLPLDEATFACMIVLMADMAEALGGTPDLLRQQATQATAALANVTTDPAAEG